MGIDEDIVLLEDYYQLEGTEWGEMVQALLSCYHMKGYLSDEFVVALETEIESVALNARENCRVVEHEETRTFTVRELEWD